MAVLIVMYGLCVVEVTAMYGWFVAVFTASTGGVCRWLNSPLCRLKKVQNSSRKLVFKARIRDRVKSLLQALHWLPVQARIDYKMSTICHNIFSDSPPAYFSDLFTVCTPSTQPRSSADSRILPLPQVRTKTFG